jgi:hypothetical protein
VVASGNWGGRGPEGETQEVGILERREGDPLPNRDELKLYKRTQTLRLFLTRHCPAILVWQERREGH